MVRVRATWIVAAALGSLHCAYSPSEVALGSTTSSAASGGAAGAAGSTGPGGVGNGAAGGGDSGAASGSSGGTGGDGGVGGGGMMGCGGEPPEPVGLPADGDCGGAPGVVVSGVIADGQDFDEYQFQGQNQGGCGERRVEVTTAYPLHVCIDVDPASRCTGPCSGTSMGTYSCCTTAPVPGILEFGEFSDPCADPVLVTIRVSRPNATCDSYMFVYEY